MSRPIQTIPFGLLGYLQLKNAGQNPAELVDTVQPVLEMREWYYETNAEVIISALSGLAFIPAATVAGNYTLFTVPNGQFWAILDYNVVINTQAGQTVNYRHQYLNAPAPAGAAHGLTEYFLFGANNLKHTHMPRSYRIPIVGPGSPIGLNFSDLVTAAADIPGTAAVRIARLSPA